MWRSEQFGGATMIVTAVAASEPDAADGIRRGNASEHSEAGRDIQILIAIAFIEHRCRDIQISLGCPEAGSPFRYIACSGARS